MGKIRVILASPKYQINLGYIARVMKNFGVYDLYIAAPRCKIDGKIAIKYSKHAHEILENAKIVDCIEDAFLGTTLATTGLWQKSDAGFHSMFSLSELRDNRKILSKDISIVIGRDDIGLTKDEIRKCDTTIFIAANDKYPVMNISHALAVILYELSAKKYNGQSNRLTRSFDADYKKRAMLIKLFQNHIKRLNHIRDKRAVLAAFRRVINRSVISKEEANALLVAFSEKKTRKNHNLAQGALK